MTTLGISEIDAYWRELRRASSTKKGLRSLRGLSGWERLRDEKGANPFLVLLNRKPNLFANQLGKKEKELLLDKDAEGRDAWFYILSSKSDGLNHLIGGRRDLATYLKSQTPQRDSSDAGWLEMLLSLPIEDRKAVVNGGSTLLECMGVVPPIHEVQSVMALGSEGKQREILRRVLSGSGATIETIQAGVALVSRILKIMEAETYSQVIPEMRYLGVLWAIEDSFDWGQSSGEHVKLRNLALAGLHFEVCVRRKDIFPWEGQEPEESWVALRKFIDNYPVGFKEPAKQDLEIGWKNAVLHGVESAESEVACSVPRL